MSYLECASVQGERVNVDMTASQDEREMAAPKNGGAFVERVGNNPCPWHVSLATRIPLVLALTMSGVRY